MQNAHTLVEAFISIVCIAIGTVGASFVDCKGILASKAGFLTFRTTIPEKEIVSFAMVVVGKT